MNVSTYLLIFCAYFFIVQSKPEYKIIFTRSEIIKQNADIFNMTVFMSRIGRYTVAVNSVLEIKRDLPLHYTVHVICYEFLNNEYRPFAIRLERRLCDFWKMEYKTIIYPVIEKLGDNFPKPKCPILKGNYSVHNFTADTNNFPPGLPFKKALVELKLKNGNAIELHINAYATVDRDVIIRERYS